MRLITATAISTLVSLNAFAADRAVYEPMLKDLGSCVASLTFLEKNVPSKANAATKLSIDEANALAADTVNEADLQSLMQIKFDNSVEVAAASLQSRLNVIEAKGLDGASKENSLMEAAKPYYNKCLAHLSVVTLKDGQQALVRP